MMALARRLVGPYRDNPYRIGYFSDNEVGWWAGALFVFYSMKPASSATKQRWVEALRRHYGGDWAGFTADFLPPPGVGSWAQLLAATGMTRMRPGGAGIHAVREWTGIVARHYYALAAEAIHAADPDALYFGDRLPIYYDPAAVRAMAPYVDAIATNYNVDSSDGWVAPYYFDGLRKLSERQAGAGLRMVFRGQAQPHRQSQQRPSDDGRRPRPNAPTGRRRRPRTLPRSRKLSAPTGSSITITRKAGAPMARITISGWSTSTTSRIAG